jgi:aminopeptidase N
MKRIVVVFFAVVSFFNIAIAQENLKSLENNKRSDTINVLDYKMNLDLTQMSSQIIFGECRVKFESKMDNIDGISLDLLQFTIDSVKQGGNTITYSYNDTLLRAYLGNTLMQNDLDSVTVYYSGTPQADPSGFGGFYFQGDYAYNLGVGFNADPHNYGRTWHPCFDNFVERATYDITMITPNGITGYSNGYIESESVGTNNENIRRWILEDNIPTYLACVGAAPYTHVNQEYLSSLTSNQIPVMLIAEPQDTTNFKNSFANLFGAMDAFETNYGPYVWNKVAFALVPFNGGAMEHATCIMYPKVTANGNLQYETLMAHELAHHWWGNLVTCRTSGDMWINEGIASYSESLFLEHVYDYETYIDELKGVHRDVIQQAHLSDGAFYPLSGVPHSATYGDHSYSKGATMMHNLRTQMGDAAFFDGLNYIQTNFAFQDIDALDFRDALEVASGQNLTPFFDGYVLNPGFNGFEIDSFTVTPNGSEFDVELYIQQKLFEAPDYFLDIPIEVTFVDVNRVEHKVEVVLSDEFSTASITVPFNPEMIYLNGNSGLLNAVTGENVLLTGPGSEQMNYPYFFMTVQNASDTSLFRAEHFRVAPDPIQSAFISHQFVISQDRFWKIGGIWSQDLDIKGRFFFNARDNNGGNLDLSLFGDHQGVTFHEDSIVLLYRENQSQRWEEVEDIEYSTLGAATDGYARFEVPGLRKGEYAFGFRKNIANLSDELDKKQIVNVYPNPAVNKTTIDFKDLTGVKTIIIQDVEGRIIEEIQTNKQNHILNTNAYPNGVYHLIFMQGDELIGAQKLVKQ